MKTLNIIIAVLLTLNITAQNKTQPSYLCSESKKNLFKKISALNQTKYKTETDFAYDVKHYKLNLLFEDINNKYIQGEITCTFETKIDNFNQIAFDLSDYLTVDSVIFRQNKLTNYTLADNELIINLETDIPVNTIDSVSIFYQGIPNAQNSESFKQTTHNGVPVIWSLSEPYGARDWWPCKQSLYDKADSVDIYITNPEEYKAASNGLLISETTSNGMKTAHWKHRHPIDTYLIAVAVTNYAVYSDYVTLSNGETLEVLNYVYPENLTYAQENTPNVLDVLQLYGELFIPYPYVDEKYGHAQFSWGGGMEHQTMTFLVAFSHMLMAHEAAHQWFGDYVTCKSWHDIWLNEGFATYLDGMTHEHNLNDDNISFNEWKLDNINDIVTLPNGSVYVTDTTYAENIFNYRLSYQKGAMVLHMLRKKIGDDAFFGGIKNYLNDPNIANGCATTADLQYHLEQTCGCSLQEFLNDWYYGEGYPSYQIYYSQNEDKNVTLTINQSQSHPSVDFFEMTVPVKFEGIEKDTVIWFNNTYNEQQFNFNIDFQITSAIFDPEHDIISSQSTISEIDTFNKSNKITLSPNPATNKITITFKEKIIPDKVIIFNSNGKQITEFNPGKYASYKFEYNISKLPPGIYYITFYADSDELTEKFIKI